MSAQQVIAGVVQVVGGVTLSPLLPGLTQHLKARLQGRPGPSVVQPYRELRRLWRKRAVSPVPRTFIYELAPPRVAGAVALGVLTVPAGGSSPAWPVGHDAIVLVGLLALARFVIALAAWDTGGGFGLMGAGRDLAVAICAEALLLFVVLLLVLPAGSTSLLAVANAAREPHVWSEPAHWAAAAGLLLVVLVEVGRQPIDNPDTHLELTMVHEGPLLEYAGRDLAYLQWSVAARHWIMLALAVGLLIPQPAQFGLRLLLLAVALPVCCVGLALVETTQVKMRLLRVPALLGAGGAVCLLGLASWLAGAPR
jgi:formate hydrogenlyase subunit 4